MKLFSGKCTVFISPLKKIGFALNPANEKMFCVDKVYDETP
jgi:hypothetical protein